MLKSMGYVQTDQSTEECSQKLRIKKQGPDRCSPFRRGELSEKNSDYLKSLLNDSEVAIPVGKTVGPR